LLDQVHPQHALQPDRRPAALPFWVVRFDDCQHVLPGHDLFHLGKKPLASGHPPLRGKLGFRKADLLHRHNRIPTDEHIIPSAWFAETIKSALP
jgi:hypothetical protein